MRNSFISQAVGTCCLLLILVGCDFVKKAPDESLLVSNPPLDIPPDFRLRNPSSAVADIDRDDYVDKSDRKLLEAVK